MKKSFIVLFLLMVNSAFNAQILNSYGIKLGMGMTNQTWEYSSFNLHPKWESITGVSARVFADVSANKYLNIEGEAGFIQKGMKYNIPLTDVTNPDFNGQYRMVYNHLNYLTASVMLKAKYDAGMFTPYILMGPQFSYLAGSKVDKGFAVVYDNLKKSNFGYTAGLGALINFKGLNFLVEYRYEGDFASTYKLSNIDIKNQAHSFMIGMQF